VGGGRDAGLSPRPAEPPLKPVLVWPCRTRHPGVRCPRGEQQFRGNGEGPIECCIRLQQLHVAVLDQFLPCILVEIAGRGRRGAHRHLRQFAGCSSWFSRTLPARKLLPSLLADPPQRFQRFLPLAESVGLVASDILSSWRSAHYPPLRRWSSRASARAAAAAARYSTSSFAPTCRLHLAGGCRPPSGLWRPKCRPSRRLCWM